MNDIITISGLDRPTITITPDAEKLKADALALAAQVGTIEDDMDRDMADKPMRDINNLLKALEKCRKEIKAPVLQAEKDIDTAAKNFSRDLQAEYDRLSRAAGKFDADARERERLAQFEAQKLAQAAHQAEMDAAAERQRKSQEEADKLRQQALESDDPEKAAKLEAEAAHNELAAERKLAEDAKAIDLIVRAEVKEAVPSVVPKGAVVKGTWEYDIVNPAELYKAHPECFKLEPVKSEIAKLLDETNGKLPGVERAVKVFKTNLRG
jgi:DNA repair exonuclease SbcCD ATPase subunit